MQIRSIGQNELQSVVERHLAECSIEIRKFFAQVAFPPARWRLSPWGDRTGGFWAVAATGERVLWYNEIEEGFNISRFVNSGEIPKEEYWCNQDTLCVALAKLISEP